MPQRNVIRHYSKGNCYHIYNRGVDKQNIFRDPKDFSYFISLMESYLEPKKMLGDFSVKEARVAHIPFWRKHLDENEVELVCYCLMPNHFHFLLKQNSDNGVTKYMRRISNAYVRYFNKKYDRVGSLFQGKYKSVLIDSDSYLLHLSRYIHLNPLEVGSLQSHEFSSYLDYIGKRNSKWLHKDIVLNFFEKSKIGNDKLILDRKKFSNYSAFFSKYAKNAEDILGELILE